MKTCCPNCQTAFRVTPEQLKARAGKVRCGQCQSVFNALDSLVEDAHSAAAPPAEASPVLSQDTPGEAPPRPEAGPADTDATPPPETAATDTAPPLSEAAVQELGKATGLILPRQMNEIHGYSKWNEGVMAAPVIAPVDKPPRWPFVLAATLLLLVLGAQLVFHWRSEIVARAPALRPLLAGLCQTLKADLPLPRHIELIGIESSDLQNDPNRPSLLVLNATLRNRAAFAQEYPLLELSLTDTQDEVVARRIFSPAEYLARPQASLPPFAADSDSAVRLWLETGEVSAAGYRVYVFYP